MLGWVGLARLGIGLGLAWAWLWIGWGTLAWQLAWQLDGGAGAMNRAPMVDRCVAVGLLPLQALRTAVGWPSDEWRYYGRRWFWIARARACSRS